MDQRFSTSRVGSSANSVPPSATRTRGYSCGRHRRYPVDALPQAEGPRRHSLLARFDEPLNLLEYVVHHEDLRRGSGPVPPRELPAAEVEEIWRRARPILGRAYRKTPVEVELVPDRGAVVLARSAPSTVTVSGPPIDLVLHAFGRRGAVAVHVDGQPDDIASFTRWASRG